MTLRWFGVCALLAVALSAHAQQFVSASDQELPSAPVRDYEAAPAVSEFSAPQSPYYAPNITPVTVGALPKNFLFDQKEIWTSPLRVRWTDARYLVPLAVFTGLLIGSDHHTEVALVHPGPNDPQRASDVANAGLAALGVTTAAMFAAGLTGDNPHAHEAGLLTAESLADTMVVNEVTKLAFSRYRPLTDDSSGKFFQGSELSFPSNHAAAAWAMASVLGQEYPGAWSRLALYSTAGAVSLARVIGQQHFPSDVLVGSAAGWLIGRYVYRAHHDTRFTDEWRSADPMPEYIPRRDYTPAMSGPVDDPNAAAKLQVSESHLGDVADPPPPPERFPQPLNQDARGSVYVTMDSWVYTALTRLWSMGFVPSQSAAIRPWTRVECLRQLDEAEGQVRIVLADRGASVSATRTAEAAAQLLGALRREFAGELATYEQVQLESVYTRDTTIAAGPALMRSWDFGQTLDNDYGRDFARGTNLISGFSTAATSGRWSFYARDEYQHRPGYSTYPPDVYAFITNPLLDGNVFVPPATGDIVTVNRQRPIEMYAGYEFGGFELQAGKQEIYLGPSQDGPLSWSINAEPTYNAQLVSTRPHGFGQALSWLGTWRAIFVEGKLSGHTKPARPWFNVEKFAVDFTPNFEISITRFDTFGGVGNPMTLHTILSSLFSYNAQGSSHKASGLDFRYRIPYARWITIYSDGYADDEVNPLSGPRRSAWAPGIYFSHLPGLPHMDLRAEVPSTLLFSGDHGSDFLYINDKYVDSNTNKAFFIGNSVGRDARRYEGWTSWWFSGEDRVELGYRQTQRSSEFLQYTANPAVGGGGTQSDATVRATWALHGDWKVRAMAQYERWYEPLLNTSPQHNITGQLELRWEPKLSAKR